MPTSAFTERKITLSAGQAAGTAAAVAANASRRLLVIANNTNTAATVSLSDASDGFGLPLPAKGTLAFGINGVSQFDMGGAPSQALFVFGLTAGDKLTVWEV